jgi:PAS domain-containing protein
MSDTLSMLDKHYSLLHFPVQIISSDGKIVYINPAFSLIWGYSIPELSEYNVFEDSELRKSGSTSVLKEVFSSGKSSSIAGYTDSLLKSKDMTIPLLRTKVSKLSIDDNRIPVYFP